MESQKIQIKNTNLSYEPNLLVAIDEGRAGNAGEDEETEVGETDEVVGASGGVGIERPFATVGLTRNEELLVDACDCRIW